MKDIFVGSDAQHAQFIRDMVKSLGRDIPSNWSDQDVVSFFNTLSDDSPRIWTDEEKADMKHAGMIGC